jgi:hypothetical protein|tara:strand:- start:416 stop:640 length:225 start_codon:yes stop_codon:yes gene_type:complete
MTEEKITVEGKEHDVSDLDDKEIYVLKQVKLLRQRIEDARINLDQLVMAERAFANTLVSSLQKGETNEESKTKD